MPGADVEVFFKRTEPSLLENAADEKVDGKTKLMEINNKHLATRGAFFFRLILHGSKHKVKRTAESAKPKAVINY